MVNAKKQLGAPQKYWDLVDEWVAENESSYAKEFRDMVYARATPEQKKILRPPKG